MLFLILRWNMSLRCWECPLIFLCCKWQPIKWCKSLIFFIIYLYYYVNFTWNALKDWSALRHMPMVEEHNRHLRLSAKDHNQMEAKERRRCCLINTSAGYMWPSNSWFTCAHSCDLAEQLEENTDHLCLWGLRCPCNNLRYTALNSLMKHWKTCLHNVEHTEDVIAFRLIHLYIL